MASAFLEVKPSTQDNYFPLKESITNINQLGDELLLLIFLHALQPENPLPIRTVCKKWKRLSEDRMLWRHFFLRDRDSYPHSLYSQPFQLKSFISGLRPELVDWEKFYLRRFHWGYRPLGVTDLISVPCAPPTHNMLQSSNYNLVSVLDSLAFTCSDQSVIQIWSMGDGKSQGSIVLDNKVIRCLSCSEVDRILSIGCEDGSIIFYYAKRRPFKRSFNREPLWVGGSDMIYIGTITIEELIGISDGVISAIQFLGEYLSLLTQDGVLLMFHIKFPSLDVTDEDSDQPSLQLIHQVINETTSNTPVTMVLRQATYYTGAVLLVAIDLILQDGSHEMAVQEFHLEGYSLISSQYYHTTSLSSPDDDSSSDSSTMEQAMPSAAVTCLAFGGPLDNMLLVTGHGDNTVHVWRLSGDRVVHSTSLFGHTGAISCVAVDVHAPVRVISGSKDRRVKVWLLSDTPTKDGTLLMTLEDHACPLASLATKEDLRLVSGDVDGCWKLWNFDS